MSSFFTTSKPEPAPEPVIDIVEPEDQGLEDAADVDCAAPAGWAPTEAFDDLAGVGLPFGDGRIERGAFFFGGFWAQAGNDRKALGDQGAVEASCGHEHAVPVAVALVVGVGISDLGDAAFE